MVWKGERIWFQGNKRLMRGGVGALRSHFDYSLSKTRKKDGTPRGTSDQSCHECRNASATERKKAQSIFDWASKSDLSVSR